MNCAMSSISAATLVCAFEEADDRGVAPGEAAQRRLPVGVGKRARVEHEVGIARNAVLEAERLEGDRQPAGGALPDALVDELAQRVHAHARGVDDQIGRIDDRLEQLALQRDGLAQTRRRAGSADACGASRRSAAAAPRRRRPGTSPRTGCRCACSSSMQLRHGGDLRRGVARIEADGGALVGRSGAAHRVRDEGLQQRRRDVVDAVEAQVLEHVQRHALAGAGQAAQD